MIEGLLLAWLFVGGFVLVGAILWRLMAASDEDADPREILRLYLAMISAVFLPVALPILIGYAVWWMARDARELRREIRDERIAELESELRKLEQHDLNGRK